MTLVLALRCADGLVLGADSRVAGGSQMIDTVEKLVQVNGDVAVMTYGLTVPGDHAVHEMRERVQAAPATYEKLSDILAMGNELFPQAYKQFMVEQAEVLCAIKASG
jgi:20S proteasome alpha/beta subunit